MDMHVEEMLGQITDFIKSEAKTETILGEQFKLGEFLCIPVMKVSMGFGSGGGEGEDPKKGKGQGGGAGAGVNLEPIGFLVTKGDDISFLGAGKTKGLSALFEKVPEMIEKLADRRKEAAAKS